MQDDADPLQVLDWLAAAVSGDTRAALARLAAAVDYEPAPEADTGTILQTLSRLSGVTLELSQDVAESGQTGVSAGIDVDGRTQGSVRSPERGDAATVAARLGGYERSRGCSPRASATRSGRCGRPRGR